MLVNFKQKRYSYTSSVYLHLMKQTTEMRQKFVYTLKGCDFEEILIFINN